MEPFNMSDLALHDKFHLVWECVCVPKNAKCLFYNHEIFYPVWLGVCPYVCACMCAPFMIIVSCWKNVFIWFAPSLVYFPTLCVFPPVHICVCVREANKNYVKTCKYALTFDLWMTNDTPLAHVRQLLIMITLVTVSFVVNNGLVGPPGRGWELIPNENWFAAPNRICLIAFIFGSPSPLSTNWKSLNRILSGPLRKLSACGFSLCVAEQ